MTRATAAFTTLALALAIPATPAADDVTARLYEAARQLEQSGQIDQARAGYEQILQSAPESAWADDALLALANIAWPVDSAEALGQGPTPSAEALAKAREHLEALATRYVAADAAADGSWRLALLKLEPRFEGYDPEDAAARLIALPTIYPDSPRAAPALALAAALDLHVGRDERAVGSAFALLSRAPGDRAAPRAWLSLAAADARGGRFESALVALGRAHALSIEGAPESEEAARFGALIDRFAHRVAQPAGAWTVDVEGGLTLPERATALAAFEDGAMVAAVERAGVIAEIAADGRSAGKRTLAGVTAVAIDAWRRVWALAAGRVVAPDGAGSFTLGEDVRARDLAPAGRELWVADERGRRVLRLTPGGTVKATFLLPDRGEPARLRAWGAGGFVVLDARNKRALFVDAGGTLARRVELATLATDPVDIALDRLDHLYVLDGREARIAVVGADGTAIARVALPRGELGIERPDALAVDGAGRVAVHDSRRKRITWLR